MEQTAKIVAPVRQMALLGKLPVGGRRGGEHVRRPIVELDDDAVPTRKTSPTEATGVYVHLDTIDLDGHMARGYSIGEHIIALLLRVIEKAHSAPRAWG